MSFDFRQSQIAFREIAFSRSNSLYLRRKFGDDVSQALSECDAEFDKAKRELLVGLQERYPLFNEEQIEYIFQYFFKKYDVYSFSIEMESFCDDFLDDFHDKMEDCE